jgi:LemA protein
MHKQGQVWLGIGIVVIVLIIVGAIIAGMYNGLVNKDVAASTQWGYVQAAYQRRADLIPNLVATVQASANFEKSTQTEVAQLRSDANAVDQQVANAKTPSDLDAAATQMTGLIGRLNVVVEAYPQLQSTANFQSLQDELAGTENRIQFERDNYNSAVQSYQTAVRSFPTNILAGMFGFNADKWQMFQASQTAQNSPTVNFNISGT